MSMGSLQGIVEDSEPASGMASGLPSPDLVAERKRLRQCADALVVRSLELKGMQATLRHQQQELANAEKQHDLNMRISYARVERWARA